MWQNLIQLISANPNFAAVVFAFFGGLFSAVFGFFLKLPLQRQLTRNEQFRAQLEGYDSLVKRLQSRNEYLESQHSIHVDYEDVLIRRIRECEERHLRLRPPP